ncbi:hypothetical protein DBA29_26490 [Xenophilus aerolatus]|nr:hypothetical protein [Xenophilus aerolatus]
MFQAFVIVSREGCELLLVSLALWAALRDAGRTELIRWAAAGLCVGASGAAATILLLPGSGLSEWFDIALTFCFGLSLALVSTGTMASVADVGTQAMRTLERWLAHRGAGVAVLVFLALSTLREVLEAFLLLRFVAAGQPPADMAWGTALGLLACALLASAWQLLRHRRGAHWAFRLSAVALFVLGAQMMLAAAVEVLLRGVGGHAPSRVARAFVPYLEEGDRYWVSCLVLALIPLSVWSRKWWRNVGD